MAHQQRGLEPFATSAGTFVDARGVAADPTCPGRVYLGLRGEGVAVSDDDGASWRRPDNTLSDGQVVGLVLDQHAVTTRLYAQVYGRGIWYSDDGAETWSAANDGLDTLSVYDLALDPMSGHLYVAEPNGGIKVSNDQLRFEPLDTWCLPIVGWNLVTIPRRLTAPAAVAATRGNRVVRHRLAIRN